MKKIFMLLVVAMATVFFTSCSKDDEAEPIISEEGIITMTQGVRSGYAWFDVYAAKAGVVITIDWGDGNIEKFKTVKEERDWGVWYTFRAKHTYSQAGSHTIKMTGALIGLGCNGDNLTSLDVSKCTALEVIDCRENQLTSLDVSKCTTLEDLNCVYNQLSTNALNKILTDLPQGKTWQEYDYTWQSEIHIGGNLGTATCNKSIAENKGWKIEQEELGH